MKGYKVFNPNMTSNHGDIIFEVGKSYKHEGVIKPCASGFHFCVNPADCFSYYKFDKSNIVCEIEASGEIVPHEDKHTCSEISIIRKIEWQEVLIIVNTGKENTGLKNTGNWNSGDSNSGNSNTGDSNSGDSNSGNSNTGDSNSGYSNTGNRNTGNWNTGNWNSGNSNTGNSNSGNSNSGNSNSGNSNTGNSNSGDSNTGDSNSGNSNTGYSNTGNWNTGNWNSGDSNSGDSNTGYRNTGAFCTDENPVVWLFDKPTNILVRDWEQSDAFKIMANLLETTMWVWSENMTPMEKEKYPTHITTGGYLKSKTLHQAWADMWGNLSDRKKKVFTSLENFDVEKFEKITGIKIGGEA